LIHNATVSGSPNADNRNTWVGLTAGSVWDEDIKATITNVSGTSTTMWAQDLGDVLANATPNRSSKLPVFYAYTSGGNILWRRSDATDFPFVYGGSNVPQINTVSGSTWSLSDVTTGYYIYWVFGTTDINDPIMTIPHYEIYATLADAQAEDSSGVFTGRATTLTAEMKLLYKLIYQYDAGYSSSCKYSILRDVTDFRSDTYRPTTSVTTAYHAALADLNISGHPAGVISLDPTFTNFLVGYTTVQTALARVDSYVPLTYATKVELSTASGNIVSWTTNLVSTTDNATRNWTTALVNTTSGNIITWTTNRLTTVSGDIITQLNNKDHGTLIGLGDDDHPQYGHLSQNETVSGNWTIDTHLGFNTSTNVSPSDGDRWIQSDKDFRVRSNGITLVDGMNCMIQCRQDGAAARQDCNTSTGVAVNWNIEDVEDYGLYGHSTSTNTSRITVSGTAWYKISYSVSYESQNSLRKNIATQLRKNGTTFLTPGRCNSFAYNLVDANGTNYASSMHRLTAGDYIEVMASGIGSTGQALTTQLGGTYIMVEFMRWG
jgi:hypothetical protein